MEPVTNPPLPSREPVVLAAVGQLVAAVVALLVAFGLELSPPQIAAIAGVWAALSAVLTAWSRSKVTPTAKLDPPA